jgi:hypothetical protein
VKVQNRTDNSGLENPPRAGGDAAKTTTPLSTPCLFLISAFLHESIPGWMVSWEQQDDGLKANKRTK